MCVLLNPTAALLRQRLLLQTQTPPLRVRPLQHGPRQLPRRGLQRMRVRLQKVSAIAWRPRRRLPPLTRLVVSALRPRLQSAKQR
jgi:hypothetical protein